MRAPGRAETGTLATEPVVVLNLANLRTSHGSDVRTSGRCEIFDGEGHEIGAIAPERLEGPKRSVWVWMFSDTQKRFCVAPDHLLDRFDIGTPDGRTLARLEFREGRNPRIEIRDRTAQVVARATRLDPRTSRLWTQTWRLVNPSDQEIARVTDPATEPGRPSEVGRLWVVAIGSGAGELERTYALALGLAAHTHREALVWRDAE